MTFRPGGIHRLKQFTRRLILAMALCSVLLSQVSVCRAAADDAERVAWLKSHASKIRSIDPADAEFSDLEPVRRAIGDARVVMLGEQSHGDGATFHAKTRLIRFLHEKCGFDVLAFESGLYDCHKAWQLMREGKMRADKAFGSGVFAIWAQSQQVQPLIAYLQSQVRGERPLELAGFDCQFTAESSSKYLPDELAAFFAKLAPAADAAAHRETVVEVCKLLPMPPAKIEPRHKAAIVACRQELDRLDLPTGVTAADFAFWKQFLKSVAAYADGQQFLNSRTMEDGQKYTNVRDPQMADNLVWLARTGYPQSKIIVWAASMHISRNPSEIKLIAKDAQGRPVEPRQAVTHFDNAQTMGHVAWRELSKDMYSVAFTAADGNFKLAWWNETRKLDPVVPGSFEELFREAGFENAFLDFRNRDDGGAWLSEQRASRPLGHADSQADWTKVFDAIVFTKTMTGSDVVRHTGKLTPNRTDDPVIEAEWKRFAGDWEMAASESDGNKLSDERIKTYRRAVKQDTYTIVIAQPTGPLTIKGRFALNPQAQPATIDAEPENGELYLGIYKLEGDTLTLCLARAGEPRPTEFTAASGTGLTMTTWKRAKPAGK